jgi:competence protein ComFA
MLVTLYEVMRTGGIERRFSLDMAIDCTYWFAVHGSSEVSLRVYAKPARVREALAWREGRYQPEGEADGESGNGPAWRTITRREWQTAGLAGQLLEALGSSVQVGKRSRTWLACDLGDGMMRGPIGSRESDKPFPSLEAALGCDSALLRELMRRLDGWRLLYTEYRRLCLDIGLIGDETDDTDRSILQMLILQERIDLASGMVTRQRRDRYSWRQPPARSDTLAWMRMSSGGTRAESRLQELSGNGRRAERKLLRCGRCNSGWEQHHETMCAVCGQLCVYCEACLQMGRVRECSLFVVVRSENDVRTGSGARQASKDRKVLPDCLDTRTLLAKWGLSPAQESASREALAYIRQPAQREGEQFLIWAVTGAGKTEMVYPLVEDVLGIGGRVLLAAPRRDVVLELAPRLEKAFAGRKVVALYGGSEDRWETGEITVATTHQLLRLDSCFDLVILDELDAFPYHNNPMLAFAARRACKPRGKTVLLTATPPREQQLAMRRRRLPHAMVPVRHHRHPLPEPRLLRYRGLKAALGSGSLPGALSAALDGSLKRGAQVFVFVPRIEHVEPLTRLLRQACAGTVDAAAVDGTSSRDEERASRVRRFRAGEIRILVTTTILERGVTIPRSDVYVLDADADLFDEAALVQMAGRAGRSADDPCGRVYFVARERTDGQMRAVRHIRAMNALARRRGLLTESEHGSSSPWSGWFRPDAPGMLDKLARAMAGAIEAVRSRPVAARRRSTEPGAGKEDAHAPMDPPVR